MANNFENPEVFMEVAEAAAGHYADSYAVKLLAFSENATYLVYDPATDEKLFVLRVGRPGYHTREEYESEISWLRQINDYTPLKVANPIPATDGSYIQEIEKDGVTYFCIATEFLTGETITLQKRLPPISEHSGRQRPTCIAKPRFGMEPRISSAFTGITRT